MSAQVLIIDLFGIALAFAGFTMAFRQGTVRRILGRNRAPGGRGARPSGDEDPLTYILRIAGVMIMVFGVVIAGMMTLFHFA